MYAGGFGTLEELLEAVTWQQLGYHVKPVGLLNIENFFGPLLAFIDQCVTEGFIRQQNNTIIVSDDPAQLIEKMEEFEAPSSLVAHRLNGAEALGEDISRPSQQAADAV